jgi:uncharacterized membrane protein YsdA (DUF1294 family)
MMSCAFGKVKLSINIFFQLYSETHEMQAFRHQVYKESLNVILMRNLLITLPVIAYYVRKNNKKSKIDVNIL